MAYCLLNASATPHDSLVYPGHTEANALGFPIAEAESPLAGFPALIFVSNYITRPVSSKRARDYLGACLNVINLLFLIQIQRTFLG